MSSKLIAAAMAVAAGLSAAVFVYSPALMLQAVDPMAVQLGFYASACALRRQRLEPCLGWRGEDAVDRGVHACVDALD
jgi:hypothetical protein